jgi:hypothetical protein
MSSYSAGTHYGYDEINVNSTDMSIGGHFESNGITSIKTREMRLQQKLNMNPMRDPYDDLRVDHYSPMGINQTKLRRQITRNPEDYFIMGQNDYNNRIRKMKTFKSDKKQATVGELTIKNNQIKKDLDDLERQNNLLTFLAFFLVIMIIVQYARAYNDVKTVSVTILDPRATYPDQLTRPATVIT